MKFEIVGNNHRGDGIFTFLKIDFVNFMILLDNKDQLTVYCHLLETCLFHSFYQDQPLKYFHIVLAVSSNCCKMTEEEFTEALNALEIKRMIETVKIKELEYCTDIWKIRILCDDNQNPNPHTKSQCF